MSARVLVVLFSGLGCLVADVVFSGCEVLALPGAVGVQAVGEEIGHRVGREREKKKGPLPESEWNRAGIWYRVGEAEPAVYVPVGYPERRARTEAEGTWVVDERDGKRFFVPDGGVEGYSRRILFAEATKVTNWLPREVPGLRRIKDFKGYGLEGYSH